MGPNAEVTETLQKFIDNGEVKDLKVLYGDNEKASTSIQIGIARLGVRSLLCINSEGILWAASETHYAANSRLPLLLVCPSRALEPPTSVLCDHDDFMMLRDQGWLMFYCEDPQDVFDTILQAYKIIENESVMLPAIVGYDGWETSHASAGVNISDQDDIDRFLPAPDFVKPERDYLQVDWKDRCQHRRVQHGFGGKDFMDLRYLQKKAELDSAKVIEAVGKEYQELFGSRHVGSLDLHRCEDAEIVLISMGIIYPLLKFVVDALRENGIKIGCVKVRVYRPFPSEALCEAIKNAKLVITIDRNTINALFSEVRAVLYSYQFAKSNGVGPMILGKVMGMGGEPITLEHIGHIAEEGLQAIKLGKVEKELEWMPLKGIEFDPTRDTIAE
jgi:pyruvate ferredoxin oxidoreductase alpha subunit